MRINRFIAASTGLSRRAADDYLAQGRVTVNGRMAGPGHRISVGDKVRLDGRPLSAPLPSQTIILHKPAGYVCSRRGQGSQTVYRLLPPAWRHLKPVGRLDKDSSGLLLLSNDGQLAERLTHPRFQKTKIYLVTLDRHLDKEHLRRLAGGVKLDDGLSRLYTSVYDVAKCCYEVRLKEGRNRQIRRTFTALGLKVNGLHRTAFGPYELGDLPAGQCRPV